MTILCKTVTIGLAVAALSGCATDVDLEDGVGHPEMVEESQQPLSAAGGSRTLAVIVLSPASGTPVHTASYLVKKVMGDPNSTTDYSVVDYVKGVSRSKFSFKPPSGTLGYEFTDPGSAVDTAAGVVSGDDASQKRIKRGLYKLAQSQDLSIYDKDKNGILGPSELTVMVIGSGGLGATRGIDVSLSSKLRYTGSAVSMGEQAAGNAYAHELTHTLGTLDLYGGPWDTPPCNSYRFTLMSCSTNEPTEYWFGLDPWHLGKLGWDTRTESEKFGWVTGVPGPNPRTGWAATLSSTQYVTVQSTTRNKEWYVFEWRDRTSSWDKDLKKEGVIAWYIAETSGGGLLSIDSVTTDGASDKSNFTMAPTAGCELDPWDATSRGRAGALQYGKSYRLKWRDGSTTTSLINIGSKGTDGDITIWSATSEAGTPSCN